MIQQIKKWIISIYMVFLIITAGFVGLLVFDGIIDEVGVSAAPTTRYVGGSGPGNWSNIQDAIDNASSGDTIRVYDGMYYENLIVNKTVSLIGNGTNKTQINGGGIGNIINITEDFVNVTGLTLTNGHCGIYIKSNNSILLKLNISSIGGNNYEIGSVGNIGSGIFLDTCSGTLISNNLIYNITGGSSGANINSFFSRNGGIGAGLYCRASKKIQIINNTIHTIQGGSGGTGNYLSTGGIGGVGSGIYLKTSNNCTFKNNSIELIRGGIGGRADHGSSGAGGIGSGIYLKVSKYNILKNNTMSSIKGGSGGIKSEYCSVGTSQVGFGIYIENNSFDNKIETTNTMDGDKILYYYNQKGINISNYKLMVNSNPTNYGKIVLINCTDFKINDNEIANFSGECGETGGYLLSGEHGNTGTGIYIRKCYNNSINNNTIRNITGGNGGTGGYYDIGGRGGLSAGIYILNSFKNVISNNSVKELNGGFGGTGGNSYPGESGGICTGIYLKSSYENIFLNNSINTIIGGSGGNGSGSNYGSGGTGGVGSGIYFKASIKNTLKANSITNINGGIGGVAKYSGFNGVPQVGFGLFIENDSFNNIIEYTNTIENNSILFYYNKTGISIENYSLKTESNPTNFGKIVLINCNGFKIKNNDILNYKGLSGETSGTIGSGYRVGICSGIYLQNSTNNIIVNNAIKKIIGGLGGAGTRYDKPGSFGLKGGSGSLSSGIHFHSSNSNIIKNNFIFNITGGIGGHGGSETDAGSGGIASGIYFQTSINNNITNNTIDTIMGGKGGNGILNGYGGEGNFGTGIYFHTSLLNTINKNTIRTIIGGAGGTGTKTFIQYGTRGSFGSGIYFYSSCKNSINNNSIKTIFGGDGGDGDSKGNGGNGGDGIGSYFQSSMNNTIFDNEIKQVNGGNGGEAGFDGADGYGLGIFIHTSNNNSLKNNFISNNNYGIKLRESMNNQVSYNNFSANNYGIFSRLSLYNKIIYNNITTNNNGIYFNSSKNNTINNNIILNNNGYGIELTYAKFEIKTENNTFSYNIISRNNIGIKIQKNNCINNIFHHNLFFFNNNQAIDNNGNKWDNNQGEGNYWSDYTGLDNGANDRIMNDGIGDTNLPHLGLDNYPFIRPFAWIPPKIPMLYELENISYDGNYTISWNKIPNIAGYILEEDISIMFDSPTEIFKDNATNLKIKGKENGTYYYRLKAYHERLESDWSNIVNIVVNWPPDPPFELKIQNITGHSITLTWEPNSDQDIQGYHIFMNNTNKGINGPYHLVKTTINTSTSFEVTNLLEETTYYFKIRAFDEVPNNSSFSVVVTATTLDETPPSAPKGLFVSDSSHTSITLYWDLNPEADVIGYILYRSDSLTGTFSAINFNLEPIIDSHYIDKNLTDNTVYYYKLKAVDDANLYSEFSEPTMGKTKLGSYPPEINNTVNDFSILEDSYDDSSIDLNYWFKDINHDKLTYRVEGDKFIKVTTHQENGTVILEPELNWNGQEKLTFFASDGTSEISDEVTISVTPVNDPPEPPKILTPSNNLVINDGAPLDFRSFCIDPDLVYGDALTFVWSSNISGELGKGQELEDIILNIGHHSVLLEVFDTEGAVASAIVNITVTEPEEFDSDGDGIPNVWEREHGFDPDDIRDADLDPDKDGLSNKEEYFNGSDPHLNDTDEDGLSDGLEVNNLKTNPNDPDTDSDGYNDGIDAYPLDRSRWRSEEDEKPTDDEKAKEGNLTSGLYLISIIIVVIIIVLLLFLFVLKPRLGKKTGDEETKPKRSKKKKIDDDSELVQTENRGVDAGGWGVDKEDPYIKISQSLHSETPKTHTPIHSKTHTHPDIKDLAMKGSIAYDQGRYTDAILAWQQVLEKEPGKHPDIDMAIKDTLGKVKNR
jgi:parallel beta-helix repeat protein